MRLAPLKLYLLTALDLCLLFGPNPRLLDSVNLLFLMDEYSNASYEDSCSHLRRPRRALGAGGILNHLSYWNLLHAILDAVAC